MAWKLIDFPTMEEELYKIEQNRIEIAMLEERLIELKEIEKSIGKEKKISAYSNRAGSTYEDLFGEEKANEIKKKISMKIRGTKLGKNNPAYKHGNTGLYRKIRDMGQYKVWRSEIFKRDNWTCQTCGSRGCYLEAHHINEFSNIIANNIIDNLEDARNCDELWDVNNGVTLCKSCHNLTKNGSIRTSGSLD